MKKLAIIAIGGNSLIKDREHQSVEDQYDAIVDTIRYMVDLAEVGIDIVLTHGNGPQVGFILRRSEIAYEYEGLHHVPLVSCVADTQGALGYQIQQALGNELKKRGIEKKAASIITQVRVDPTDPAFSNPSKPIGTFYAKEQKETLIDAYPDWQWIEDTEGCRRVVPSPKPVEIIERDEIASLVNAGYIIVAVGGGGIPVIEQGKGYLQGIDAVIDKDAASALLASELGASFLIISTKVNKVCLNFGKSDQMEIDQMTKSEAKVYIDEGHFAPGSMLPKIQSAIDFIDGGGERVIITSPEYLKSAFLGNNGTHVIPGNKP